MTRQAILDCINKNPGCFLATAVGDVPHVRGMGVVRADDRGILFTTGKIKELHRQLQQNPRVEICFYDPQGMQQLRISGTLEPQDDMETKRVILEKYPFLKPYVEKNGFEALAPQLLRHGQATFWTMATNFEPKKYFEF